MKASDRILNIPGKLSEIGANYEALLQWLPERERRMRAQAIRAIADTKREYTTDAAWNVLSLCNTLASALRQVQAERLRREVITAASEDK